MMIHAMSRLHHYGLWKLLAWGEGVLSLVDGATYFVQGNKVSHGPSFLVLRTMPGGMHTYGAVMLVFAAYIFYSSSRTDVLAIRVQLALCLFALFLTVAIVISWIQAETVAFGSITKWFFVLWCALALAITATAERKHHRVVLRHRE